MWTLTKRVLPQHTDYAGVMWHGAYVQWLEEARVEALQAAGLGYAAMTAMGVDMPVVSLQLEYRHPLRHGDEVCVESRCSAQKGVRWPWASCFIRGDTVVAEATVQLVMLRQGRVLRRVPSELQLVMQKLVRHGL
ncbi:acyl-CoA thioesterase [Synechococcus sp. MU1611]|uniref:acyl-CoA thioesterase n=1 Tax=Synechococcus sp. MU1611 TaxID=2508345 RepID=UPI001CF821D0|nr:acyl-CoA thioesterase [Synechococcus sp. MU1611]MCB4412157.1 acyl-CoA thioesterase [Synechococcus sp. MU1611]